MKKNIGIVIALIIQISCVSSKKIGVASGEANTIAYIIPHSVEELLRVEIKKNNENIYFEMWNEDSCYRIFLHPIVNYLDNPWVKRSNRKLYINQKLFPLVFDFDRTFAITDSGEELLKKMSLEQYPLLGKKLVMNHGSYYIKFEKNTGKIIQTGYDGLR